MAVGDLHGDMSQTMAVLTLAGIVDDSGHWAAGSATFVQTGDQTDRGPDSKGILELLTRLETEAEAAGGTVIALIGNHEVMNVQGDWRYVTEGDVAAYGGVAARNAAFSAEGASGRFIRQHDAVAQVGDTVFVHAGISAEWAAKGIDGINTAVREGIEDPSSPVLQSMGPLWYREYSRADEAAACAELTTALASLGAERMVVGHTVQASGTILSRCDGRFTVIDVGIATHYGGHLAAWESIDGDARALTPDGPVDLFDPP